MKIWIVSSDPFLNDFENISQNWPGENEIIITTLTKYGLNLRSFIAFGSFYFRNRPNIILTDHGYFGFSLVKGLSKIFHLNTKIFLYLRGNWWLEEKMR